jgi:hypothetical protein
MRLLQLICALALVAPAFAAEFVIEQPTDDELEPASDAPGIVAGFTHCGSVSSWSLTGIGGPFAGWPGRSGAISR